jgi:hypothetical protein
LVGHFDVEHSTFQFEPVGHGGHEVGAHSRARGLRTRRGPSPRGCRCRTER